MIFFYAKGTKNDFKPIRVSAKKTGGWTGRDTKLQDSVWQIPTVYQSKERKVGTGFPTRKPLPLLERIILASTIMPDPKKPEDKNKPIPVVFDPFCGCATTMVMAELLGREWIGIDISPKAVELVNRRIHDELKLFAETVPGTDIPLRTDMGNLAAPGTWRDHLYGVQGGHCGGCREHFQTRHLEVDHIIARSKGGTDHVDNLQLLCGSCNRIKGNRGMEYLRTELRMTE